MPKKSNTSLPYPYNLLKVISTWSSGTPAFPTDNPSPDQLKGLDFALSTLCNREREILIDRYKYGKTYTEIANQFHFSRNNSAMIIHNAIRHIRFPCRLTYIQNGYSMPHLQMENRIRQQIKRYATQLDDIVNHSHFKEVDAFSADLNYLNLPPYLFNILSRHGIFTVIELCLMTKEDLLSIEEVCEDTVDKIRIILEQKGLKLRT